MIDKKKIDIAVEKNRQRKKMYFLVEELGDFLGVQRAAVTEFADTRVLDDLSDLGSGGVFKLGGDDFGIFVEK